MTTAPGKYDDFIDIGLDTNQADDVTNIEQLIIEKGLSASEINKKDISIDMITAFGTLTPQIAVPINATTSDKDITNYFVTHTAELKNSFYIYPRNQVGFLSKQGKEDVYHNSLVEDLLRRKTQNNIFYDTTNKKFVGRDTTQKNDISLEFDRKFYVENESIYRKIKIKLNSSDDSTEFFDKRDFPRELSLLIDKNFIDFSTTIPNPFERELQRTNTQTSYIKAFPKYNFYDQDYEQYTNHGDLLNIYSFIDLIVEEEKKKTVKPIVKFTPKQNIFNDIFNKTNEDKFTKIKDITRPANDSAKVDLEKYGFLKGISRYNSISSKKIPMPILSKVVFSKNDFKSYMAQAKTLSPYFPMNIEIRLANSVGQKKNDQFFETIDMAQIIARNNNINPDLQENILKFSEIGEGLEQGAFKSEVMPLYNFFETVDEKAIIFGEKEDYKSQEYKDIIYNKVSNEYAKKRKDITQIYAGEPNKSEIILYKISKYLKGSNVKIQEIYVPNLSKLEMSYIDTQIRFGLTYKYVVSAIVLVFAYSYNYNGDDKYNKYITGVVETDKRGLDLLNADRTNILRTVKTPLEKISLINLDSSIKKNIVENKLIPGFKRSSVSDKINEASIPVQEEIEQKSRPEEGALEEQSTNTVTIPVPDFLEILSVVRPYPVVIEIPYHTVESYVLDSPPVHPFADFYSYEQSNNKILLNLIQNSGRYEALPIYFNEGEQGNFLKIKKYQDRKDDKVLFKSDDTIKRIQILRLDKQPTNIYDFYNDPKMVIVDLKKTTSYIDNIIPNKKYYYIFRSLDVHTNVSNPSPVYQIELRTSNNSSYLENKIYNFEQESAQKFKTFRRFLYIDGSFEQTNINFKKSNLKYADPGSVNSIVIPTQAQTPLTAKELGKTPALGDVTREESIFGEKTFKIKIKSINSGKGFDVLLKFKTEHIK